MFLKLGMHAFIMGPTLKIEEEGGGQWVSCLVAIQAVEFPQLVIIIEFFLPPPP